MSWIAGIDVGGTFTDLLALDPASGEVRLAKVPTTPENQAYGVLAALDEAKLALGEVALIVHGTTTTTNALLERKLAKTGLITTQGFRDVLELGRRTRPTPYGLKGKFVPIEETIASFKKLTEGEYDHIPEQAFFMAGNIEDVERNAAKLKG